jgi:uncharacterized protein YcsI (UPF0317 family)
MAQSGKVAPIVEATGEQARLAARSGVQTGQTSGTAPNFVQANLLVLPSKYASDFRLLCRRNPVPCPLLAESKDVGTWDQLRSWILGLTGEDIAKNLDLRNDFPSYMVYQNGVPVKSHCLNVESDWTSDHVGFLIGCSYSFESALATCGLVPAHMAHGRNVPMYRTTLPLCPAGAFKHSTFIVSMRAYPRRDIEKVKAITRPYVATHGEPIDCGWDAVQRLGITDINVPDFGDAPVNLDGTLVVRGMGVGDDELIPVFWACGVTPQEAVRSASLEGTVIGHAPGCMIVLDIIDRDIIST